MFTRQRPLPISSSMRVKRSKRVTPLYLIGAGIPLLIALIAGSAFLYAQIASHAAAVAAANPNCTLVVPANPLTAAGLATPYQLVATNAAMGPCNQANVNQTAFVQGAIVNPATGQVSLYDPLVIDQGTQPAVVPTAPTLPANAVVGLWFGFQGTVLTLQDTMGSLAQGQCVNGAANSPFGEFAYCNAPAFFQAANTAIQNGQLQVPAPGVGNDGLQCLTTRDFGLVDQDQSDNVTTSYLLNGNNQVAQNTAANRAQLAAAAAPTILTNASDNLLLTGFEDKALGCTPMMAPNVADNNTPSTSLPLDELQAAAAFAKAQNAATAGTGTAGAAGTGTTGTGTAGTGTATPTTGTGTTGTGAAGTGTATPTIGTGTPGTGTSTATPTTGTGTATNGNNANVNTNLFNGNNNQQNPQQNANLQNAMKGNALNGMPLATIEPATAAIVPLNDPMVLTNANPDPQKEAMYQVGVDQPQQAVSGISYCMNIGNIGPARIAFDMNLTQNATSPAPAVANNLYTFLANRINQSWMNLNCAQLLGQAAGNANTNNAAPQGVHNDFNPFKNNMQQQQQMQLPFIVQMQNNIVVQATLNANFTAMPAANNANGNNANGGTTTGGTTTGGTTSATPTATTGGTTTATPAPTTGGTTTGGTTTGGTTTGNGGGYNLGG